MLLRIVKFRYRRNRFKLVGKFSGKKKVDLKIALSGCKLWDMCREKKDEVNFKVKKQWSWARALQGQSSSQGVCSGTVIQNKTTCKELGTEDKGVWFCQKKGSFFLSRYSRRVQHLLFCKCSLLSMKTLREEACLVYKFLRPLFPFVKKKMYKGGVLRWL